MGTECGFKKVDANNNQGFLEHLRVVNPQHPIAKGVKDFDIHFFYRQNPAKPRLSRAVKRVRGTVSGFGDVGVDFVRTVIPVQLCAGVENPVELVRIFLLNPPTPNAQHLSQNAVIGVCPNALFGVAIWPPDQQATGQ